ncbi:hypothetical protein TRFO_14041 [Tritrichomonas foetus]|uniref:Arrestin-like N-terminal domain-containing protein n=1 Tax=Tritrichomonas foetus TaxID=1144522 RepID=A0A1J4L0F7_9EUKA|nr:hypothetical protein TRFO_14041 [Tritrichomonas foetus]|eukprot:OHT15446.1 hypothetical protein TRFO_14041 [Tritrichomonas foetus]
MRITLVPDNPIIFLGQKFTIQINITDCDTQVMWVSAQIAGKVKSLKQSTLPILSNLVYDGLGVPQNSPFFGHVTSGSRLISTKFDPPKSFCAFIVADGIPPSYEGEGISISYELRFAAQILGQPVNSISIPIRFIAPHFSHTNLERTQSSSTFTIDACESLSVAAPFALSSPFHDVPKRPIEIFPIKNNGQIIANIKMSPDVAAGSSVNGIIDLSQLKNSQLDMVIISITRNEIYEANGTNESAILETATIDMKNTLARRFNLPISFHTVAEFGTNVFNVSYSIDFRFQVGNEYVQFSTPLHIFPPALSLSTPRSPISSI